MNCAYFVQNYTRVIHYQVNIFEYFQSIHFSRKLSVFSMRTKNDIFHVFKKCARFFSAKIIAYFMFAKIVHKKEYILILQDVKIIFHEKFTGEKTPPPLYTNRKVQFLSLFMFNYFKLHKKKINALYLHNRRKKISLLNFIIKGNMKCLRLLNSTLA